VITLNGSDLGLDEVHAIAVDGAEVSVDPECLARVERTFARVQTWGAARRPIYGVNTGFGELAHVVVAPRLRTELQVNLLRSHASSIGERFDAVVTRAILAARLNCLIRGRSGVSTAVVRLLVELLNRRIHPIVPQQGSLGASGDLSPLSHAALVLIGEGQVEHDGVEMDAATALAQHGLVPVELAFKEGLALVNGTSASAGAAAVALTRAEVLLHQAVLLSAVYVQCLRGSDRAYDRAGHEAKGHPGQVEVAAALSDLLKGSMLTRDHVQIMDQISSRSRDTVAVADAGVFIQDAYSLRCVPQILGPVRDTLRYCAGVVHTELNSSNDNPLFYDEVEETFHGGNFHGQYVGMAADFLAIALTELGVLAERQVNRVLDPHLNGSLPDFLVLGDSGLSCGLAGVQYLATSIAAENLDLSAPASVKTIPSNGGNQDVVSMSLTAARKALRLCENVATILAVEAVCLFQACHLLGVDLLSPSTAAWHHALARHIAPYQDRQPAYLLVQAARDFLLSDAARQLVGGLVHLE
jgi:tyrosine 2,3-aminomutase